MKITYRKCDRCGKEIKDGYLGDGPSNLNYPMYSMSVTFGMHFIHYNGCAISDTKLDLCDECLGFFLDELNFFKDK